MRLIPRSLFFKMAVTISLLLVIVFGTSSYVTFRIQSEQALEATKNQAILLTRALKNTIRIGMESGHVGSLMSVFQTVGALPGVEKLRVFNEDGIITYSMKISEIGRLTEELDYRREAAHTRLYGAMLAGVDYVLMGAGIPRTIPGILDSLAGPSQPSAEA